MNYQHRQEAYATLVHRSPPLDLYSYTENFVIAPIVVDNPSPNLSADCSSDSIRLAIEHAKHYLPTQGPIAVFIHHNTLHAFEHLPFDEAVLDGLRTYGSQPYWQESRYREELARDRIQLHDLEAV